LKNRSISQQIVAGLLFVSAGSVALGQSPPADELKARIDQVAQQEMVAHKGVGLMVGVAHNGERSIFAYGETFKGNGQKPDSKTLFQIGSITKTFTAALLADAVRRGKAQLNDPLKKYFPRVQVPAYGQRQITLLDLAAHTSALPRSIGNWQRQGATIQDMLNFLGSYHLNRAPGERYEYSNLGFALLGHALAHSANTNWAAMVHREIVVPLQLRDTTIEPDPDQMARRAQGYGPRGNPAPLHSNVWPMMAPAGGLYSTMDDMLEYLAYNMGERQTPLDDLLPMMHQARHAGPRPHTQVGLAWEIQEIPNGGEIIWKNGGTPGFHSYIGFNLLSKTGVVVLTNSAMKPMPIVKTVFSQFRIAPGENPAESEESGDE
jgi:serine-type D-Ala-D-Ala carboxypeptidase/endopeptidase